VENALSIDALASVRAEVITLGLNQVGREPDAALGIEMSQ